MFQVDEMIIYGKHGVCKVIARGKIDMPMIDKNKEYYTLLPCREKAAVVYAPVENNKIIMRYVLTPEEQLYGELSFVLKKTKDEILEEICWE